MPKIKSKLEVNMKNEDIQNGLTAIVVGIFITIGGSFYIMISMFGG